MANRYPWMHSELFGFSEPLQAAQVHQESIVGGALHREAQAALNAEYRTRLERAMRQYIPPQPVDDRLARAKAWLGSRYVLHPAQHVRRLTLQVPHG